MRVGGQRHAPAALPHGKKRYPFYRRLGGLQDRSGRVRKISPPTGIRYPDRPARSESLYRLGYLAHLLQLLQNHNLHLIVILFWMQINCFIKRKINMENKYFPLAVTSTVRHVSIVCCFFGLSDSALFLVLIS
jgi:hypothetical protein